MMHDRFYPLVLFSGPPQDQHLVYIAQRLTTEHDFLAVVISEFSIFAMTDTQIATLLKEHSLEGSDLFSEDEEIARWESEGGLCL